MTGTATTTRRRINHKNYGLRMLMDTRSSSSFRRSTVSLGYISSNALASIITNNNDNKRVRLQHPFRRHDHHGRVRHLYQYHKNNGEDEQMILTSTKSATVKYFKSLIGKKKARRLENCTVVEGYRLIHDLLQNPKTQPLFQQIIYQNNNNDNNNDNILRLYEQYHHVCDWKMATEEVVNACCDTVTPQGIVATISIPPPYNPGLSSKRSSKMYVILDGVSDPGNVGTILRSSLAVGAEAVILLTSAGSCDVWNPKAVRSAMGASFQIPTQMVNSWDECYDLLTNKWKVPPHRIYAATMDTSNDGTISPPHYQVSWIDDTTNTAIIIGKEGPGLSENVRHAVSNGDIGSVHVPMETGIESLNAAVCTSVILFEYYRQYQTSLTTSPTK